MLETRMPAGLALLGELKQKGYPLAYVGDVVGTGSPQPWGMAAGSNQLQLQLQQLVLLVVLCRIALCKNHQPPHPSPLQGPTANERPSPPDRGEHLGIGGGQILAQAP